MAKTGQKMEALNAAQEQEKQTYLSEELEKCLDNYQAISAYLH